jgi:hypothetical protein
MQRNLERKAKKLAKRLHNHQADMHHVPPRSNGYHAKTGFILVKRVIDHRAYHQLFKNAGTYQECCDILWTQWWKNPSS